MTILEAALACPLCVVTVTGAHAGEGTDAIFDRKTADIARIGKTFWLMKSPKARPPHVQEICMTIPAYTIFIEPASMGGARPTTIQDIAEDCSADGVVWHRLPKGLSPVTGKLDNGAAALVFDMMTTAVNGTLDLWGYADSSDPCRPVKFILGSSTVCAVRKDMKSHAERIKSRYRRIVAVARLAEPYCVWLR